MSDTRVDMAKVTQMLDAGWDVSLWKDGPFYGASATHQNGDFILEVSAKLEESLEDSVVSRDSTPQQVLTRLAYKVHGEII